MNEKKILIDYVRFLENIIIQNSNVVSRDELYLDFMINYEFGKK